MTRCPQCKREMRKMEFDAGYGVKVESMHCEKCGFNITQKDAMSKALKSIRERMSKEVKLVQVGTGIGIRIPNMITKALGLRKGREVLLEPEEKGIRVVV